MPPINRRAVERLSSSVILKTPEENAGQRNRFNGASVTSQVSQEDYRLISPAKVKVPKQPGVHKQVKRLQSRSSCVLLANGKPYHQKLHLPWKLQNADTQSEPARSATTHNDNFLPDPIDFFGLEDYGSAHTASQVTGLSRHQRKRANQWLTWQTKTIPTLVQPLLRLRAAATREETVSEIPCHCTMSTSQISVTCIYWQRVTTTLVSLCTCVTVAEQLVSCGLFPCAPFKPSFAVDVDVLDLICHLNAYQAPNNAAWCRAFMAFHTKRKNQVAFSFDSLKRRFSNTLFWYSVLDNTIDKYLDNILTYPTRLTRECLTSTNTFTSSDPGSSSTSTMDASHVKCQHKVAPVLQDNAPEAEHEPSSSTIHDISTGPSFTPSQLMLGVLPSEHQPTHSKASLYLQNCCPCCFGGDLIPDSPQDIERTGTPTIIVQIDANFGQKRHHGKEDFAVSHPYTRFLSESAVNAMEAEVQAKRPDRLGTKKSKNAHVEDQMEVTGLPTSVLDACENTFKAADDRREKASTQFFSDTGLMALLCRHDHVLFITNMKSAGEKQFYVLALIDAVFKNLPDINTISVGVLYDIGCQMHRSFVKWGFLPKYHSRLTFGVSIFHAYGHEWPCQLIYNPRKRAGFGLSNGEGCERLWSRLKELIPNLRITGFHKRLYTLDNRIQSDFAHSLESLSIWLYRNYTTAENKLISAQNILDRLQIPDELLRRGWQEQIIAQTKPLPSQSRNRAEAVIQGALRLRQEITQIQENIANLEADRQAFLTDTTTYEPLHDIEEADIMLSDMRARLKTLMSSYHNRLAALGVEEKHRLSTLLNNEYLTLRINLRAKKQRIRERLRRRKMELNEITKRSIPSVNDRKLTDHSEKHITKREPTIIRLISEYNKGCSALAELIRKKRYPRGSIVLSPQTIDPKRVFSMDIDDSIWEDVGLEDDSNEIPRWLGDEDFRQGIRAMLERDRAREELQRLKLEVQHLQTWMIRIVDELTAALAQVQNIGLEPVHAALQGRLTKYQELFLSWSGNLERIPGYSHNSISIPGQKASGALGSNPYNPDCEDESDEGSSVTASDVMEECGFIDTLEMITLNEGNNENNHVFERRSFSTSAQSTECSTSSLPQKRQRIE